VCLNRGVNMFVAFDGDSIGRRLELYLLQNRELDVKVFSAAVTNAIQDIGRLLQVNGGEVIICSGDSVLAKFPKGENVSELIAHCEEIFQNETGSSISSGSADDLRGVLLALKIAKGKKSCPH
jgi:hypothetical protein